MLASGELAAVVGVEIDSPDAAPLIPDPAEAGFAALQQRGLYPINHLVVVRDDLLAERPELGAQVFDAFARSKQRYVERLRAGAIECADDDRPDVRTRHGDDRRRPAALRHRAQPRGARGAAPARRRPEDPRPRAAARGRLRRRARATSSPEAAMRIAIAADHNGVALKARLIEVLRAQGHEVDDRGADGDRRGRRLPAAVRGRVPPGGRRHAPTAAIVVGGSGLGEVIACNKIARDPGGPVPRRLARARSRAATTTPTCWCWARRSSTRAWPSRWWTPG